MNEAITGDALVDLRQRLGLSQQGLAQLIGVSFVTISRWENGHNEPNGPAAVMLNALRTASEEPGLARQLAQWSSRGCNLLWARVFELAHVNERAGGSGG